MARRSFNGPLPLAPLGSSAAQPPWNSLVSNNTTSPALISVPDCVQFVLFSNKTKSYQSSKASETSKAIKSKINPMKVKQC